MTSAPEPDEFVLLSVSGSRHFSGDDGGITLKQQHAIDLEEANGGRGWDPRDLSHLSAAEARALYRRENGLPTESAEEHAAAEALLAAAREARAASI